MHLPEPTFPPLLTGHAVKRPARPFAEAVEAARAGRFGAGDVAWSRNVSRLECAIVLEPEVRRERAMEMLYVAMVAFGDAFGAVAPPEVALTYRWPQTILVNGAIVGDMPIAMAAGTGADGAPAWLVIGAEIALRDVSRRREPGHDPGTTTLFDEGCGEVTRTSLIESFCRHFLAWVHTWEHDGFAPAHRVWLGRAHDRDRAVTIDCAGNTMSGTFVGLDECGNLLLRTAAGVEVVATERAARILNEAVLSEAGAP
ncbi:MAG: biotin/lipoate--protein ligase family protein [Hyphomicrobiales bacterium]|nr:biotin/lipoate--protein ligase family protein [Hyphomicrobiales bacterium]